MVINASFGFDENADLESNLAKFEAHLGLQDAVLSGKLRDFTLVFVMRPMFPPPFGTPCFKRSLMRTLRLRNKLPPQPAAAIVAPVVVTPPVTGPSGWFLEGLSIEGFRGINNEGKLLELRFKTDKVNNVSAVNGVGKTSVYDAIRYAISGRPSLVYSQATFASVTPTLGDPLG